VSHETIYNAIYAYPRGELKKQLLSVLRQARSGRRSRAAGKDRRGQIPEMVSIHLRSPQVNDRLMPGHWEGDLIKWQGNRSAVGVLVERSSRLVLLCKMADATAEIGFNCLYYQTEFNCCAFTANINYDRGKEMAYHRELEKATNIRVYFCDPHSPWQRGSCENTNGLLRQYLPKGSDLSVYSQEELDAISNLLNNRPRQTLNWDTPYQTFQWFIESVYQLNNDSLH